MTRRKKIKLHEKILEGIKTAIDRLYADAKKHGWDLIVSENGKIKKIKVK